MATYIKQNWLKRLGTGLNKFLKTNENLSSVELTNSPDTITQAGTPFSETLMNHMEEGIYNAHVIGTPIDRTSTIFDLTGDGVPDDPDDPSGVIYRPTFSTVDGWYTDTGGSVFVSSGVLSSTATTSSVNAIKAGAFGSGRTVCGLVKSTSAQNGYIEIKGTVGGVFNVLIATIPYTTPGVFVPFSAYVSDSLDAIYFLQSSTVNGDVLSVKDFYIGTGAYLSKVPNRAGGEGFSNSGVTPVSSIFGKALKGNGAGYLVGPAISGDAWTLNIKYKHTSASTGFLIGSPGSFPYNNIYMYLDSGGVTTNIGMSDSDESCGTGIVSALNAWNTLSFVYQGVGQNVLVYKDGSYIKSFAYTPSSNPSPSATWLFNSAGFPKYDGELIAMATARVMTAGEIYKWYVDPTSVDSQIGKRVTQTTDGLMAFSDKVKLDEATSDATANKLAVRDAYGKLHATGIELPSGTLYDYRTVSATITIRVGMTSVGTISASFTRIGRVVFVSGSGEAAKGSYSGIISLYGIPFAGDAQRMLQFTFDGPSTLSRMGSAAVQGDGWAPMYVSYDNSGNWDETTMNETHLQSGSATIRLFGCFTIIE